MACEPIQEEIDNAEEAIDDMEERRDELIGDMSDTSDPGELVAIEEELELVEADLAEAESWKAELEGLLSECEQLESEIQDIKESYHCQQDALNELGVLLTGLAVLSAPVPSFSIMWGILAVGSFEGAVIAESVADDPPRMNYRKAVAVRPARIALSKSVAETALADKDMRLLYVLASRMRSHAAVSRGVLDALESMQGALIARDREYAVRHHMALRRLLRQAHSGLGGIHSTMLRLAKRIEGTDKNAKFSHAALKTLNVHLQKKTLPPGMKEALATMRWGKKDVAALKAVIGKAKGSAMKESKASYHLRLAHFKIRKAQKHLA